MIKCQVCSADNIDAATLCAVCGADLPPAAAPEPPSHGGAPGPGAATTAATAGQGWPDPREPHVTMGGDRRSRPGPSASAINSLPRARGGAFINILPFVAIGIVATFGAFYAVGEFWPRVQALVFERGWVPFVLMTLFGWSLGIIWVKYRETRNQMQALDYSLVPANETIGVAMAEPLIERISSEFSRRGRHPRNSILARRLWHALETFKSQGDVAAVTDNLRYEADMDANSAQSGYAILKVFIWAMPIIGFIGTVIGIGDAVGGFSSFIQGVQDVAKLNEQIKPALGGVTQGLSVAFDTTLLALLLTVPTMLLSSHCQKQEDEGLTAIERYCVDDFVSRLEDGAGAPGGAPGGGPGPSIQDVLVDVRNVFKSSLIAHRRGLTEHVALLDEKIKAGLEAHGKLLATYAADLGREVESVNAGLRQTVADADRIAQRSSRELAVIGQSLQHWQKDFTQRLAEGDRLVSHLSDVTGSLTASADSFRDERQGFEAAAREVAGDVSGAADRVETALAAERDVAARLMRQLEAPRRIRLEALEVVETRDTGSEG